ncbi:hypothetical protein [Sorangium sp. So ce426]|uniref:hypothetical protein n=1 Tax=unclassified Sorangium TaxID=2621164 RepID=UPI003F5B0184
MTKLDEAAVGSKPRPYQLTPDMKYSLSISGVTSASWAVYVTGPASGFGVTDPASSSSNSYPTNTELWEIDPTFLHDLKNPETGTTQITIGPGEELGNAPSTPPPVDMPAQSLWTPVTASALPPAGLFLGTNAAGDQVGLDFALKHKTPWRGTVTWYVGTQSGSPPQYAVDSNGITLTYDTVSSPAGVTWYKMTQSPLSWGQPATVGGAALGVGLAQLGDTFYLAFTNASDSTVSCSTSGDGATWSDPTSIGISAAGEPALASLDGTLYLVYQKSGSSSVKMCTNAGEGWSKSTHTGASASSAPALSVVSAGSTSVLCMAYLTASGKPHMHVRTWNGSRWSPNHGSPGVEAAGAPALVGYNGQLLLAQQGAASQTIEIYATHDVQASPESWSWHKTARLWVDASTFTVTSDPSAPEPASPLVLSNPSFCAYLDRLYLAFTDASQNVWICSSDDGKSWSGFAQLPEQIAGCEALANPALAAFTPSSGIPTLALAVVTGSGVSVLTAT